MPEKSPRLFDSPPLALESQNTTFTQQITPKLPMDDLTQEAASFARPHYQIESPRRLAFPTSSW